uniref:Uncharacterized protein n=1 Tax=Oryza meridionalis TaxID=40149 RepID=A0A0E0F496_9ORYZ
MAWGCPPTSWSLMHCIQPHFPSLVFFLHLPRFEAKPNPTHKIGSTFPVTMLILPPPPHHRNITERVEDISCFAIRGGSTSSSSSSSSSSSCDDFFAALPLGVLGLSDVVTLPSVQMMGKSATETSDLIRNHKNSHTSQFLDCQLI